MPNVSLGLDSLEMGLGQGLYVSDSLRSVAKRDQ